ncbi:hypothetical protein REPUB_Repub08aG0238500 [Reevesia pubescens]
MSLPENARQLLVEMRGLGLSPNVICYTALIGGYCRLGQMDKVGSLLQEMSSYNVKPNKITYTVMIDGYCKLGNMKEASKLLGEMVKSGIVPDAVTYNAFTNRLCKEVRVNDAFKVSDHIVSKGLSLDEITYTTLIHGWHQPSAFSNQELIVDYGTTLAHLSFSNSILVVKHQRQATRKQWGTKP